MINRRAAISLSSSLLAIFMTYNKSIAGARRVIDDMQLPALKASNGATWQFVSDGVMGGVSKGTVTREMVGNRSALRMRGSVSLDNNGGFIQMALDLSPDGAFFDASAFTGIEIDVTGNSELYNLHVRTSDLNRPWQSYRHSLTVGDAWTTHRLPFARFEAYRTQIKFNPAKLRRVGIVAIGRAFEADISLGGIRFY